MKTPYNPQQQQDIINSLYGSALTPDEVSQAMGARLIGKPRQWVNQALARGCINPVGVHDERYVRLSDLRAYKATLDARTLKAKERRANAAKGKRKAKQALCSNNVQIMNK